MFANLRKSLSQVGEMLAPIVRGSNLEEIQHHWSQVLAFHEHVTTHELERVDDFTKSYTIDAHLDSMCKILKSEEEMLAREGKDTAGPCVEFIISAGVIKTICSLAELPHAPMLTGIVLHSLVSMLKLRHRWLPNMGVHQALMNMINNLPAIATPDVLSDMTMLLLSICRKIRIDPSLLNFFFIPSNKTSDKAQFELFQALLPYVHRSGAEGDNARSAVLCLLTLPDLEVVNYVLHQSHLTVAMAEGLTQAFEKASAMAGDTTFGANARLAERVVTGFYHRLQFCNQVAKTAHIQVVEQLVSNIDQLFLEKALKPALLQTSEIAAVHCLKLVQGMFHHLTAPLLISGLVKFVVGPADAPAETKDKPDGHYAFGAHLLRRLDSLSEDLCVATLELLDTLVAQYHQHVLHVLMMRNLQGGRHLEPSAVAGGDDEVDKLWGRLLPCFPCDVGGFSSSEADPTYGVDAERHISIAIRACDTWESWDNLPLSKTDERSSFYEGLFLELLFKKWRSYLDNSFRINLWLTAVTCKLCMCPISSLHSYLLDPQLPLAPDVPSLPRILSKISDEAKKRAAKFPDLKERLRDAHLDMAKDDAKAGTFNEFEDQSGTNFVKALVVLEEFCKELFSTLTAKARFFAVKKTLMLPKD